MAYESFGAYGVGVLRRDSSDARDSTAGVVA